MSERLAWARDLGMAPAPDSSEWTDHSAVEAGADRAEWSEAGSSYIAELRDAMHGVLDPVSLGDGPAGRWEAEGHYLEFLPYRNGDYRPCRRGSKTTLMLRKSWCEVSDRLNRVA